MKKIILRFCLLCILSFLFFVSCTNPSGKGKITDVTPQPQEEPESGPESEPQTERAKLTLMVYMAADNDLESYALSNLKDMEKAVYEKMNVLVLLDRAEGYDQTDGDWTDTRLFEVMHDQGNGAALVSRRLDCAPLGLTVNSAVELDMANPSVLKKFIEFGREEYEAECYALVIWGHGTGWRYCAEILGQGIGGSAVRSGNRAVAIDDKTGTYMSVKELGGAVRNQDLSVIGFDTCFGGVIENVYELKDCADYTVACPGVTPGGGWDYKAFLETLSAGSLSKLEAAKAMAQSASVQTTVFRNEGIAALFTAFEVFCEELAAGITDAQERTSVFNALFTSRSYSYTQYPCDMYLDVGAMADLYCGSGTPAALKTAALGLKSALNGAVAGSGGNTAPKIGVHFIPLSASHTAAASHSQDYIKDDARTDQCAFIKQSRWWCPTVNGNSGSLLDKLFYTVF